MILTERLAGTQTQRMREQVKLKPELLEQHKARAAQVRARVKWVEKDIAACVHYVSSFYTRSCVDRH